MRLDPMGKKKIDKITIIGSGLAGSFLAFLLAKKGYTIDIYERLAKENIFDEASKRSYNIVLFGYGITVLKEAGLWEVIEPYLLPLNGSITYIANEKEPIVTRTDPKKTPYFTISRALVAKILLEQAAKNSSVTIHYNTTLLSIDRHTKSFVVQQTKTQKIQSITTDLIIGADGAHSLIRSFLQLGQETHTRQEYAPWTYRQFILSPEMVKKLALEEKFVHIWTQKKSFIILHPDKNGFMIALFVFPQKQSLKSAQEIKEFFTENFPKFSSAYSEIIPSLLTSPNGSFVTIYADPWYYKDFVAIIGDAAHGFYPFFGQGTSAAFGDVMKLIELIDENKSNWEEIFRLYQEQRKRHTDALADLSKDALLTYFRDKKADKNAVYDRLETIAHHLFPRIIYPPVSLTITSDPIHAADHREKSLKQQQIAQRVGISLLITLLINILFFINKTKKR